MARTPKPSERRTYDVEMIRDFLDHLTWELRISQHEFGVQARGGDPSKTNPELCDQLEKYSRKRQTAGLLAVTRVNENPTAAETRMVGLAGQWMRARHVEHLEALRRVFKEALTCAAHPKELMVQNYGHVIQIVGLIYKESGLDGRWVETGDGRETDEEARRAVSGFNSAIVELNRAECVNSYHRLPIDDPWQPKALSIEMEATGDGKADAVFNPTTCPRLLEALREIGSSLADAFAPSAIPPETFPILVHSEKGRSVHYRPLPPADRYLRAGS